MFYVVVLVDVVVVDVVVALVAVVVDDVVDVVLSGASLAMFRHDYWHQ